LLRNERGTLPLGPGIKSIAVIGAQAGAKAQRSTQGSAFVESRVATSITEAIKARAGAVAVSYAQGSLQLGSLPTVPSGVLKTSDGTPGLAVEYFGNHALRFEGKALRAGVDGLRAGSER
jgi:beta-glucosidase